MAAPRYLVSLFRYLPVFPYTQIPASKNSEYIYVFNFRCHAYCSQLFVYNIFNISTNTQIFYIFDFLLKYLLYKYN